MLIRSLMATLLFSSVSSFASAAPQLGDVGIYMKGLDAWGIDACRFTGCWRDFNNLPQAESFGLVVKAQTSVQTGGVLYFVCKDGSELSTSIPSNLTRDFVSPSYANLCGVGGLDYVTLQAGLQAQYFDRLTGVIILETR